MDHVDRNMFGSLPLTLYLITKDERYREMGMPYADTQWEVPENASASAKSWAAKGYSWQTRLWIDDMYMIPVIQTHAYKVTGELKYVERAAKEMAMYLDELQRTNGLFYHAPDVPYFGEEERMGGGRDGRSASLSAGIEPISFAYCQRFPAYDGKSEKLSNRRGDVETVDR